MSATHAASLARGAMSANLSVEEKLNRIAQAIAELAQAVAEIQRDTKQIKGR